MSMNASLVKCAVVAALGGLLFGFDTAVISGTTAQLTAAYSLTTNQLVWSALTKTVDPDSARKLLGDTSKVVASQLTKHGLAG